MVYMGQAGQRRNDPDAADLPPRLPAALPRPEARSLGGFAGGEAETGGVGILTRWVFASLILCATPIGICLGNSTEAASFDCDQAKLPVEKAICKSPILRSLDRDIAAVYRRALGNAKPSEKATILDEQRKWLKERDISCGVPASTALPQKLTIDDSENCLIDAYRSRYKILATSSDDQGKSTDGPFPFPARRYPFTPMLIANNDTDICRAFEASIKNHYFQTHKNPLWGLRNIDGNTLNIPGTTQINPGEWRALLSRINSYKTILLTQVFIRSSTFMFTAAVKNGNSTEK
jgi:uncharacterized protein